MDPIQANISTWPVSVWVILLAVVAFVAQFVVLWARRRPYRRSADQACTRLERIVRRLGEHAEAHGQRLPDDLAALGEADTAGLFYRPVPTREFDARLMLVGDAAPTQKLVQFPVLRDGRCVAFCSGRIVTVTEEAYDKLREADDALRESLGLETGASTEPVRATRGAE